MNATAPRQVPQQLSAVARIAVAFAAGAVIATGVSFAAGASNRAVHIAQDAINPAVRYIVLERVEVVARRQAADAIETACAAPAAKQI